MAKPDVHKPSVAAPEVEGLPHQRRNESGRRKAPVNPKTSGAPLPDDEPLRSRSRIEPPKGRASRVQRPGRPTSRSTDR
jgi:hypothetical protein